MIEALKSRRTISPNRLLNAWKWFEALPETSSKRVVKREHSKTIASLVSTELKNLGYDVDVEQRAKSAISKVSLESNRDRFLRLTTLMQREFRPSFVGQNMVDWLCKAYEFRGGAAHGGRGISEADFDPLELSIDALEAMNTLLLLSVLDLDAEPKERVGQHRMVETFHFGAAKHDPSSFV